MKVVFCSRATYEQLGYELSPEVIRLKHYSELSTMPSGTRVEVWDCYKGDTDDMLALAVLNQFGYIRCSYHDLDVEWDDDTEGM
jgi:hypothetical protein